MDGYKISFASMNPSLAILAQPVNDSVSKSFISLYVLCSGGRVGEARIETTCKQNTFVSGGLDMPSAVASGYSTTR